MPNMINHISAVREAFAAFLQQLIDAEAMWLSVRKLKPGVPSLSDLLKWSEERTELFLISAGFGKMQKDTFCFEKAVFDTFIIDNSLGHATQSTKHRVHGFGSNGKPFLRIGGKKKELIPKPGIEFVLPRIHFLESRVHEFKKELDKAHRKNTGGAVDGEQKEDESSEEEEEIDEETNLIMTRLKTKLLPLMLRRGKHRFRNCIDATLFFSVANCSIAYSILL